MTNLDNQIEELIKERNAFEAENIALKAQVNLLRESLVNLFNGAWDEEHTVILDKQVRSAIDNTPEQCLNSVKADAIDDAIHRLAGIMRREFGDSIGRFVSLYANKLRGNNG